MTRTMAAAVAYGHGDLRVEEVPVPDAGPGMLLVRVMACSICGTDIRIFRKGDYRAAYPVIIGHEIAGVVEEIGAGVSGYELGDRVCVAPGHGCGRCRMCQIGQPNVCVDPFPSLGYKVNGGFADYIAVPENIVRLGFVNPIPPELTFEQAAMSEIIACCLNAQNNSPVHEGDIVLVIGAGPAGLIHSMLARTKHAAKVIVTQRSADRFEMLRSRVEVNRTVASSREDLAAAVLEETGGKGADVVYVCAPSREAQETACRLVGARGRVNLFGGLPKDDCSITIDANSLHYREFSLAGASSSLPEGNREALRLLANRTIDPDRLITHRYPLASMHDAIAMVESRQAIKVVVNP